MNATPPFLIVENERAEDKEYLNLLIYGVHGAGKTFLAGTCVDIAEMNDVFMLSVEGGDMTLRNNQEHDFRNIDKVQARNFSQIAAVQKFLIAHCGMRDREDESGVKDLCEWEEYLKGKPAGSIKRPKRYRTIIIDSLTEIDSIHRNMLLGIEDDTPLEIDPNEGSWAIYNKNLSRLGRFVKQLRDLPIHTIFTCGRKFDKEERKNKPKLVGQFADDVQGIVDVVGFLKRGTVDLNTGEVPRALAVMPGDDYDAKCRWSANTQPVFIDPTVGKILAAVGLTEVETM